MSHTATLRCKVENLDCLEKAATDMGLVLQRDKKTFKAYSTGKCEHAIGVKGNASAYEIGLAKQGKDKHYSMMFDDYNGGNGLMAIVGTNCHKLVQNYALEVAKQYIPFGFELQVNRLDDGSLELNAMKF